MKKQKETYSTQDMLRLISNAGMNLLVRKKKTALQSKIQRQKDECNYLQDILTGLQYKLSNLDPEFKEAQSRLIELQRTHSELKAKQDSLQAEIARLEEVAKKAEALQGKTTELSKLLGDIYTLKTTYDNTKIDRDHLAKQYEIANQQKTMALNALQAIKSELSDLEARQQTLISEIAGFDIEGYIKGIETKVGQLESAFSSGAYKASVSTEMDFISTVLMLVKSIEDITGVIDGASDEDIALIRGLRHLKDSEITKTLRQRLMHMLNEIHAQYSKELSELTHKRQSQEHEINTLNASVAELTKTLTQKKEELKTETDFRDNAKAKILELETELNKKKSELKDAQSELQRLNVNIELSKAFAEALAPINETLMKSNRKLYDLLSEYKEAYERALMRLKKLS